MVTYVTLKAGALNADSLSAIIAGSVRSSVLEYLPFHHTDATTNQSFASVSHVGAFLFLVWAELAPPACLSSLSYCLLHLSPAPTLQHGDQECTVEA
jgi:hypothetical protein